MSSSNTIFENSESSSSYFDDHGANSRDATSTRHSSTPDLARKCKLSEDAIQSENENESFSSGHENEDENFNSNEHINENQEVSIPIPHETAQAPTHEVENAFSSSESDHEEQQTQHVDRNELEPASAKNPRKKTLAISTSTPPKRSHKKALQREDEAFNIYTAPPDTRSPSDRKPQHPRRISTFKRGKKCLQTLAENPFGSFHELQTRVRFQPRGSRSNEKGKACLREQSELMKIAFEIFIGEREDGERGDKHAVRCIPGFVYAARHPVGGKLIEDYRRENVVRGLRAFPLEVQTGNVPPQQQSLANQTEQQTLPGWTLKAGILPRGSFVFFYLQRTRQPADVARIEVLCEEAMKYTQESDKVWLDMLTFVKMVASL